MAVDIEVDIPDDEELSGDEEELMVSDYWLPF